jgi:hypothetical protein
MRRQTDMTAMNGENVHRDRQFFRLPATETAASAVQCWTDLIA